MAAAAVICAACGAKVRGDRAKCLRCRSPLVARHDAPAAKPIPWKTVGIGAACVTLVGFSVMLAGRSSAMTASHPESGNLTTSQKSELAVQTAATAGRSSATDTIKPDPAALAVSDMMAGQKAYVAGNIDEAAERLKTAVETNPRDHRALNDLGQVLVRAGRAKEATLYLDKAVELEPDSWTYQFNRARAYAQLKDWDKAIEGYRAAEHLFPGDYATQYNLAKALQASGNLNAALTGYEKAIQMAPRQSDFQLSYGLALEAARRPQDAATAYRRYLELEPESADAEKVKAHLAELQPASTGSGS